MSRNLTENCGNGITYTGIVAKSCKSLGVKLARETLESTLVHTLRLARQDLEAFIDGREGGDVLVLDNVGVFDQAVDITGDVKRSRLIAPGGSSEGSREEGENDGETHDEVKEDCKGVEKWIGYVR